MPRYFFPGLRVRLLLLVLLAVIPALGMIMYTNVDLRRMVVANTKEDAVRLARLAASDQADLIRDTHQLLFALAQLPQVRNGDPEACSAFFAQLLKQYPQYTLLGVVGPNGEVFCSSAYTPGDSLNVADQTYFQQVMQTREFAISGYQVDQISGKAILNFGYPVVDEDGQVQAVVFASLDLTSLNQLAAEAQLPQGSTFTVIDRNSTILVRYPNPEAWVGKSVPEAPVIELILTQNEGTAEVSGVDNVSRLFAFTPLLSGLGGSEVYVSVGIPTTVVFADANRVLIRNLIGLGVAVVFALLAVWLGGHWFILRWVNVLVNTTQRLSAGDLGVRTGLPHGRGELSHLARAFDEMAETLERHTTERDRAEATLRETQRTLSTLLSNLPGMAYRCGNNRNRTIVFASEGCLDLIGFTPTEMKKGTAAYGYLIHPDDREMVWNEIQSAVRAKKPFRLTYRLTTASGSEKWVWEQGQGIFTEHGELLALEGFITDATERMQAYKILEQRVADRTRHLSALYDVTAVASESLNLETILNRSLKRVLSVMNVEVSTIHLFEEANNQLSLAAWQGILQNSGASKEMLPLISGLTQRTFEQGQPVVESRVKTGLSLTASIKNLQPYVGVPMRAGGKILGVLSVVGQTNQQFTDEDVALLDSIADQVGVAVENGLLYRQAEQLAVMEERSRLARELHDSVTQSLYSLTLYAEVGRRAAEAGDLGHVVDYLTQLGRAAQQTLKEMRLLVFELRTPALETDGLVGALQQRLDAVEKRAGIEAHLLVEEMAELPALVEEGLYRIAQEALNNALKHAGASVITVKINVDSEWAALDVTDNGRAFDSRVFSGGMGLTSMQERVKKLGGGLTISSKPGEGTCIQATVPTRRSWSRPVLPIDNFIEVL